MGIVCILNLQLSSEVRKNTKDLAMSEELVHRVDMLDMMHNAIRGDVLFLMVFNDAGSQNKGREELNKNLKTLKEDIVFLEKSEMLKKYFGKDLTKLSLGVHGYIKISTRLSKKLDIFNENAYISQNEYSEFEQIFNDLEILLDRSADRVVGLSKTIGESALSSIDRSKNLSILLFIVGGVVSSLVVLFMANSVTAPLNDIVVTMERLATGDLRSGVQRSAATPRRERVPKTPPLTTGNAGSGNSPPQKRPYKRR